MKRPIAVASIATALLIAGLAVTFAQGNVQPETRDAAALTEEQASPIAMTQALTTTVCANAWYESQAKAFCTSQGNSVTSNNQCYLERECGTTSSNRQSVTYTGSPNNVKKLHWCVSSNGIYEWLQVGDC